MSAPVRSPIGWHVIQIQERRDQDANRERKRLEARRAVCERKSKSGVQRLGALARDRA